MTGIPKGCKEFLINNTNLEDGKEYNIFISIKDGENVRVNCSKKGETAFTKVIVKYFPLPGFKPQTYALQAGAPTNYATSASGFQTTVIAVTHH